MFFKSFHKPKSFLKNTCTLIVLFAFVSCSIGERKEKRSPVDVEKLSSKRKKPSLGCLKDFSKQIQSIIEGKESEKNRLDEIENLRDCSQFSLKEFTKLVVGKNQNEYKPEEVRDFLERFYLKDHQISDRFLKAIMKLKVKYFKGKIDVLKEEDIVFFLKLIDVVFNGLASFNAYYPLSMSSLSELPVASIDHFQMQLNEFSNHFTNLMNPKGLSLREENYEFQDFLELIQSVEESFSPVEKLFPKLWSVSGEYRNDLQFLKKLQKLIYPDCVNSHDMLKQTLTKGIDLFSIYLKFNRVLKMESLYELSEQGRDQLYLISHRMIDVIEAMVQEHKKQNKVGLSFDKLEEVMGLFFTLDRNKDLKIKKDSLKPLFSSLIGRFFYSENKVKQTQKILDFEAIENARKIIDQWLALKVWVDVNGLQTAKRNSWNVDKVLNLKIIQSKLPFSLSATDENNLLSFQDMIKNSAPMYNKDLHHKQKRAIVYTGLKKAPFTVFELNIHTYLRSFLFPLLKGYDEKTPLLSYSLMKKTGKGSGLTLKEFEQFVRDIYPVLIDIKFLSTKNSPEADSVRRFREASLFTMNSDGDSFLSLNESVSIVLHLAEAKSLSKDIYKLAQKKCLNHDSSIQLNVDQDEFGNPLIEPRCFRDTILDFDRSHPGEVSIWKDFPNLLKYYSSLNESDKRDFRYLVEIPSRKMGYQEKVSFETSDIESLAALMRYVETVIERFDQNKVNTTLDRAESKLAFPLFRNELKKYKPDMSDDMLYVAFTWMLNNGGEPVSDQMGFFQKMTGYSQFFFWKLRGDYYSDFESTRKNIISIFGMISQSTQTQPTNNAR